MEMILSEKHPSLLFSKAESCQKIFVRLSPDDVFTFSNRCPCKGMNELKTIGHEKISLPFNLFIPIPTCPLLPISPCQLMNIVR